MNSVDTLQGKSVTCTVLDHGIYELTFKDSLRTTVDEYYEILGRIFSGKDPDGPTIRILTDGTRIKTFPIVYTAQRAQAFIDAYPVSPTNRFAMLYNEGLLFDLLNRMISILHLDTRRNAWRYFKAADRDKAIAWLLEDI